MEALKKYELCRSYGSRMALFHNFIKSPKSKFLSKLENIKYEQYMDPKKLASISALYCYIDKKI